MTRRFQVGDRVRVIDRSDLSRKDLAGAVGTLVALEHFVWDGYPVWRVDFCLERHMTATENTLRLIHDGDEKLSWSDERVAWKPRVIA